jgi:hypothetical protein
MAAFERGNTHGGRKHGARNRFARRFIEDALASWEEHGAAVLEVLRHEDVATYAKLMASLLPRQQEYKGIASGLTLEELDERETLLAEMEARALAATPRAALPAPKENRIRILGVPFDEKETKPAARP